MVLSSVLLLLRVFRPRRLSTTTTMATTPSSIATFGMDKAPYAGSTGAEEFMESAAGVAGPSWGAFKPSVIQV